MKEFKLDQHPKISAGFKVPENYFDTFSATLLADLPNKEAKVIPLFSKRKKLIWAAAAILIGVLSIPLYNHFHSSTAAFDSTDLENYLAYQPNITEYDLINEINLNQSLPLLESTSADLTTVEDYLIKEGNIEQLIIE